MSVLPVFLPNTLPSTKQVLSKKYMLKKQTQCVRVVFLICVDHKWKRTVRAREKIFPSLFSLALE